MMNAINKFLVLIPLAVSLSGCLTSPDVDVSIEENEFWGSVVFKIQAKEDEVLLKSVEVNRGNCKLPSGTATDLSRTVSLKFGQVYTGYAPSCKVDQIKEIDVQTDRGTFTFSF
jgi:hypothetical protein